MSIVERTFEEAGVPFERDVPLPGHRRTRDWAKVIGTLRRLESQEHQQERESHLKIEDLSIEVAKLVKEVHRLGRENEQLKLKERMVRIRLPEEDQKILLEGPKVRATA